MKRLFIAALMLTSVSAFAAQNDILLTFSTKGPDKYANGDTVVDGECYCIVWTQKGYDFEGFEANGLATGERSKVVLTAPIAKNGCCPKTQFQIGYQKAAALGSGNYGIYLLDTRSADDGKPQGTVLQDGVWVAKAINSWGQIADATTALASSDALSTTTVASQSSTSADTQSLVPADAPQPTITDIKVVDGKVEIKVADTVSYLQYTVKAGVEPKAEALEKVDDVAAQGNGDVITISYPVEKGGKFFRATRK